MPKWLRLLLMVLVGALLATLTRLLLTPFLPPQIVRYLALGLALGAITFFDEAFIKRNRNALWQAAIAGVVTAGFLYVLDLVW